MIKRYLLIANPLSGSPPRKDIREEALALLRAARVELTAHQTQRPGHAEEIARQADLAAFDALVVLGGDGTLHEVASGMLAREDGATLPLGLIPAGTGNSLALGLRIGKTRSAVDRILHAVPRPIDAIRILAGDAPRYCLNLVGWAAGQAIAESAERLRWLGASRYAAAALQHVLTARRRAARLCLDGKPADEDEFLLVLACNTPHVGSGMLAAPLARLDDGLMDVVIVRRASRWRLLELLRRVHDGSHVDMREVEIRQARRLSIQTPVAEPLNLDGELRGTTPLEAEVLTGAISVLA